VQDSKEHADVGGSHADDEEFHCESHMYYLESVSIARVRMPTPNRANRPKARKTTRMVMDSMWCFICFSVVFVGECVKSIVRRVRS